MQINSNCSIRRVKGRELKKNVCSKFNTLIIGNCSLRWSMVQLGYFVYRAFIEWSNCFLTLFQQYAEVKPSVIRPRYVLCILLMPRYHNSSPQSICIDPSFDCEISCPIILIHSNLDAGLRHTKCPYYSLPTAGHLMDPQCGHHKTSWSALGSTLDVPVFQGFLLFNFSDRLLHLKYFIIFFQGPTAKAKRPMVPSEDQCFHQVYQGPVDLCVEWIFQWRAR